MSHINKSHLSSLTFAIRVLSEVKGHTLDPKQTDQITAHIGRLRTVKIILLDAINQQVMDFHERIARGLPQGHASRAFADKHQS